MRATKESCQRILHMVHDKCRKLPAADFDALIDFLLCCRSRLPSEKAVMADAIRSRSKRKPKKGLTSAVETG